MTSAGRVSMSVAAGLMVVACQASISSTPMLPCAGHICAISIQNDGATFLSVSYVDSTGRTTVLGLVNPAAVRLFRVQWVRSATVRILADIQKGGTYFTDLALLSTRTNELHFPEDFEPVDDALSVRTLPPGTR
jgi:hypothetical protein